MAKIKVIGNIQNNIEQAVAQAVQVGSNLIVRDAINECPVDEGYLARSIAASPVSVQNGIISCSVGTNVVYAPYVEYGTGAFSALGNGRKGYWVYVKGSDGSVKSHNPKEYTLEEAKQVMAILRSKGLNAFYTCGQKPHPFLQPAVDKNRDAIIELITEAITNAGLQNNANQ